MNLPPWQADSQFPTARRKLLSHNAYQMTMTPRRCQSCHGPRRPRLLQPSERPPLTCRSRPTPRGLVEFYSWWTVVERVGPVAIRSAPPSTAGISGAVRCDFCGDSSGRVVGAAAPPPRPARRPPAQLRRPPRHLPLRRMQTRRDGSPVGNRPNTRFRPGDAELHRCFTALKGQRRGILSGPRYARALPRDCGNFTTILIFPWCSTRETVSFKSYRCVSCRSGAISMR